MVNVNRSILSLLNREKPLSGESMAAQLGMSRVAIWKRIKKLQEEGYPISSGHGGYMLTSSPLLPLPDLFPESFPLPVHYKPLTSSTMDDAREAEKRSPGLFLAGSQKLGRGRRGRSWISPEGGIYASLLLFPETGYDTAFFPVMLLAVSLVRLLREEYRLPAAISWPNDIHIGPNKAAGILTELHGKYDLLDRQIIGIGINLAQAPPVPNAVSIAELLPPSAVPPSPAQFTAALFSNFSNLMSAASPREAAGLWKLYSGTLGKQVRVERSWGSPVIGRAVNIGDDGSLMVETASGEVVSIREGDCRIMSEERRPPG
jgi:BirA family biotin operon repressor/biotin-[acetyl-CoA-carboxylase] ligase